MESNEVWTYIELKMKILVPPYMKHILKCCGYDNYHSIATIADDDFEYLANEVKQGRVAQMNKDDVMITKDFVWCRGHQKLLIAIVKLVKETFNESGIDGFSLESLKEKSNKTKTAKPKTLARKTPAVPRKQQRYSYTRFADDLVDVANSVENTANGSVFNELSDSEVLTMTTNFQRHFEIHKVEENEQFESQETGTSANDDNNISNGDASEEKYEYKVAGTINETFVRSDTGSSNLVGESSGKVNSTILVNFGTDNVEPTTVVSSISTEDCRTSSGTADVMFIKSVIDVSILTGVKLCNIVDTDALADEGLIPNEVNVASHEVVPGPTLKDANEIQIQNVISFPKEGDFVIYYSSSNESMIKWPDSRTNLKYSVGQVRRLNGGEIEIQLMQKSPYSQFVFGFPKANDFRFISNKEIVKILDSPPRNLRHCLVFKDKSLLQYKF